MISWSLTTSACSKSLVVWLVSETRAKKGLLRMCVFLGGGREALGQTFSKRAFVVGRHNRFLELLGL